MIQQVFSQKQTNLENSSHKNGKGGVVPKKIRTYRGSNPYQWLKKLFSYLGTDELTGSFTKFLTYE